MENTRIAGIGTDLVEIKRIAAAMQRPGFCRRIFTAAEQELCAGNARKAAGNFAVKEAVVKAFGTGFGRIWPNQIEVLREMSGKPFVILYGAAREQAEKMGMTVLQVSISNEREYALAFVVLEASGKSCSMSPNTL